jgi:hypothetical protein
MLLTPDTPSTASRLTRNDTVFVLVLTMALVVATSAFFASFTLAAIVAGALLSLALHRYEVLRDGEAPPESAKRLAGINIASIRVGGDAGGLIFVVGSVAIVMLGLPSVRWFLLASVLAAGALAAVRIAWARRA